MRRISFGFGFPDLAAQFIPPALAEQRGFFKRKGCKGNLFGSGPRFHSRRWPAERSITTRLSATHRRGDPGTAREGRRLFPAGNAHRAHRPARVQIGPRAQGQGIGLNTFGGTLESIARLIVKHFGLDPDKDVKFLATGTADSRFAAMEARLNRRDLGSAHWIFSATSWVRRSSPSQRAVQFSRQWPGRDREEHQRTAR